MSEPAPVLTITADDVDGSYMLAELEIDTAPRADGATGPRVVQ